ncbi:related to permease of the major facilitator superfamily [Phialocephala subalpina]|uniref:Related to permease of the major facilitator superfamily n=1 Tax=Phialocephala subalpina TaxID=576137 RepID=A0A1L7WYJ4_9HELO|nr:related to permease of the major facilitator superfamily [Phialocephala subalpina]
MGAAEKTGPMASDPQEQIMVAESDIDGSSESPKGLLANLDLQKIDKAAEFLANNGPYPPMTPEAEKRMMKKIDGWMIPFLMFFAILSAVDKVELSTASLYGFQADNGLKGQEYSWCGSILSLGMITGTFPLTYLVHRLPTAKLMAVCSVIWSGCTLLMAVEARFGGIMAIRFFMGFFESIIQPGLMLIMGNFWKIREQPWRIAFILSCFSSVVNGFWSWVVGQIPDDAPLKRWQYLFLLTGSINLLYSIVLYFFLPDSPMNAFFLTKEEKWHAVQRLAENKTGMENHKWKWDQAIESVVDPKFWLQFFFSIAINISNAALITFGPLIIKGLGYDSQTSALLSMPTGVMSTLAALIFSTLAGRWHNRRCLCVMMACVPPLIGTILAYVLPRSNMAGQMIGLYLMYMYWGPYSTAQTLPMANTAGHTKRAVTYGMLHVGYAVGNMIGPQTFRTSQAPRYTGGIISALTTFVVCAALMGIYWIVAAWQNKKKDQVHGKAVDVDTNEIEVLVTEYLDETDEQQPYFRYMT